MNYNPVLGMMGNIKRAYNELNKANRNIFNTKSEADQKFHEVNEALVMADNTAIELFEAQLAQEEINTAQDDALIEIYEMLGGE